MNRINCIFLIDDNQADNVFHKIRIREAGVCNTIQVATNGRAALTYLRKAGEKGESDAFPKPDLIFLDINLPGVDGFEFLDEFHKLNAELRSDAVIVMLTTSLNPDDHQRAMDYEEVKKFLNKPLTVGKIQETVETFF